MASGQQRPGFGASRREPGRGATGSSFHWVVATSDGIRVTEVWATREQFDRFAETDRPDTAEVAFPAPPKITVYDVHNYDSTLGSA